MALLAAGLRLSFTGSPPSLSSFRNNSQRYHRQNSQRYHHQNSQRYHRQNSRDVRPIFVVRASSADSSFSQNGGGSHQSSNSDNKSFITAIAIPLVSGLVVAAFNPPDKWYFQLRKPAWTPPAPLFGLVWSLIYPLMGIASWGIWEQGGWEKQALPLTLYALQLMANLLWQVAFFGLHNPALAFKDICVLTVLIALCVAAFRKVNPRAGNLMKIYLAWVLFAAVLNYRILKINPPLVAGGASPPAS